MKLKTCLIPLLLSAAVPASADMLGARIGANAWSYDTQGSVRQNASSRNDIDVNRDLGYDSDNLAMIYAIIEQPIPFIPDLKISKTNIDTNATGELSQSFAFGGKNFTVSDKVTSNIQLDQTDVTLYWHVLDNIFNLDIGLTGKYLETTTRIQGSSVSASANFSTWVPMAYAGVGIDLPFSGLSVSADGSYIGYGSSNFYDYTARVTYETPWFLGIDAGYRRINLTVDDIDGVFTDLTFKGPYAGLYLYF